MAPTVVLLEGHRGSLSPGLSPRRVAGLIRALDSRLVGIEYDASGEAPTLVYIFELAGIIRQFAMAVRPGTLNSIADLYPEAAAYERDIERRCGLAFRPPDEVGERP